jgi:hypothetical protein
MPRKRCFSKCGLAWLPIPVILLGCALAGAAPGTNPATQTALAHSVLQYATLAAGRFPTATHTPEGFRPDPPTVTATPPPADTPAPTETLPSAPAETVGHTATPPDAGGVTRYIIDAMTRDYAPQQKVASGSDDHLHNRYERPYTAETMDYLSDVDLTQVDLSISPPWVYLTFHIAQPRPEGIGQTLYGVEFDTNRDGRGEYLIWGASPPDGEWTAAGVEVRRDANADVGGQNPQWANAPWTDGDGYEKVLFASGQGADPDLAWIRQVGDGHQIQLAFKYIAIGNAVFFLWNGVADFGLRRPDWYDYNDRFTQSEAGSPLPIQAELYPLHALWGIDNTCRDAYGYEPTGMELGLCM